MGLQRTIGNQAVCRLLDAARATAAVPSSSQKPGELRVARPRVQRATAWTMGGRWTTNRYELVRTELGRNVTGAEMELSFSAEDPVDAELIGLTQTVRGIRKGRPRFVEKTSERRATHASTGVDEGAHIDQPETANPLYATGETQPGDTLETTPVALPGISVTRDVHDRGRHGSHYRDAAGTLQHQDAILIDTPLFRDPAPDSSQTFETAALAIKGRQQGVYYGSVRWGWESDASGNLTKIPLTAAAGGVPSATFLRAAELWNTATTAKGLATVDLPIPKLPSSPRSRFTLNTAALVIELARVTAELAPLPPGLERTNKEVEKAALEFELAKRRDKPSISLDDQKRAAAALSSAALIKRALALPEEIWKLRGEPWRGSTTDRELEWEAVDLEIRKRNIYVTVHVLETEDVFSDTVYIEAGTGTATWSSSRIKLDDGDEHTFAVPLSSVFPDRTTDPGGSPLKLKAYDEDVEGDDLMFVKSWPWADLPSAEQQSRDGGTYNVRVDLSKP